MKKIYSLLLLSIFIFTATQVSAQAFRKGAFLISLSEGGVTAQFSTKNNSVIANDLNTEGTSTNMEYLNGIRDPLFIEYGLSNRIGVGLSVGGDIWKVNPRNFYGINAPNKQVNILTTEFTFDVTYHMLVSQRFDWTLYTSVGSFGVEFNEEFNGEEQHYLAEGGIFRLGTSLRYYVFKRWAIMGMVSHYDSKATPNKTEFNNLQHNYTTSIKGWAYEFGLSFRIGKYDWKKPATAVE